MNELEQQYLGEVGTHSVLENHIKSVTCAMDNLIEPLDISERIRFNWSEIEDDCLELASKIKYSKIIIISLGTGGWIPSKLLKSLLVKNAQSVELTTIVAGYTNLHTPDESVGIINNLSSKTIARIKQLISNYGYELILFDTLINTGRSIHCTLDYLQELGFYKVRVATLHWEIQPKSDVPAWRKFHDRDPDFFARKVLTNSKNPYIEYPWDTLDI